MTGREWTVGAATIGVLCLDTAFTKIPGHIRNGTTFDFPVVYRVVEGATPERLVARADPSLLAPFIAAAQDLERRGVSAITGACGFLVLFQAELAASVRVPLFASSLIQLPLVHRMLRPDQTVGLLVAKADALSRRHLAAVGAEEVPVCVAGLEDAPEFRDVILRGARHDLDAARLEREVLERVADLVEHNPEMGALVIECTDLPPFAHAIQARFDLPVFDIVTLTEMVHRSLSRKPYGTGMRT